MQWLLWVGQTYIAGCLIVLAALLVVHTVELLVDLVLDLWG